MKALFGLPFFTCPDCSVGFKLVSDVYKRQSHIYNILRTEAYNNGQKDERLRETYADDFEQYYDCLLYTSRCV